VNQQNNDALSHKQTFNLLHIFGLAHQRALTVPLRSGYGVEALGLPCLLAVVMMFLWAGFSRDPFLLWWLGIWFVFQGVRRFESLRLNWKGVRIHTHYDGWPHVTIRLGRTEGMAKLVAEPLVVGVLGGIIYWVYQEQGWSLYGLPYFFLTGCFTLPFVELINQMIWKRRAEAMLNARIEQENIVDDFRRKYGDS
jgi:hypothetical protein